MKKLTMLLLMIMFLSACSSARPVIRLEESTQAAALAQTDALTDHEQNTTGEAEPKRQDRVSEAMTMATDARATTPDKTKPEQMISASDKEVAVNNLAVPSTQAPQTAAKEPVPQVQVEMTQPPASGITGAGEPSEEPSSEGGEAPSGEGGGAGVEESAPMSQYNLFDYYPLVPNREVRLASDSFGASSLILQYLYEERGQATAQIKQTGAEGVQLNVIRIADGEINDLYYSEEMPYRANIIGWSQYEERTILKEPLQVGNQWESTGLRFQITAVDETRIIGGEEMTVLDVMVSNSQETVRFTYALGLGLVSNDIVAEDGTLTNIVHFDGLLEEADDRYDISLFFPAEDGSYIEEILPARFRTNDASKDVITQGYKDLAQTMGHAPVFGGTALIQYIYLEEEVARVDLNDGFIAYVNEVPDKESAMIQSLVNTISKYYGVAGVILTVNDQRYESAQLKFDLLEVLRPDFGDTTAATDD